MSPMPEPEIDPYVAYGGEMADLLDHFDFGHLPAELQSVSRDFHDLAHRTAARGPLELQTKMALTHLLIAKDAAVRAVAGIKRRQRDRPAKP